MEIKLNMRACRENVKLTQKQIAIMLGITREHYNRMENGKAVMKKVYRKEFSNITHIPIEMIIFFDK